MAGKLDDGVLVKMKENSPLSGICSLQHSSLSYTLKKKKKGNISLKRAQQTKMLK